MKQIVAIAILVLTLTSCQEQKIGFIDNAEVINEYQEKKDIEEKYKVKGEAFQKRRDSMVSAYQLELKDAQIRSRRLSQKKLQELSQEIQQKEQLLGQKIQFEQQQLAQQSQAEIDSLISKVRDFVKDYGKKNGYNYILGSNEAGSVLYGEDKNDLTKTILDALNAAYKK